MIYTFSCVTNPLYLTQSHFECGSVRASVKIIPDYQYDYTIMIARHIHAAISGKMSLLYVACMELV